MGRSQVGGDTPPLLLDTDEALKLRSTAALETSRRPGSAHKDLSFAHTPSRPLDPLPPLKQTARRKHTHRPNLAGLLARPTLKPSPCPTLPHFDRLPLDSPASISTVRSYSSSFRTLVFFSTLVPLSYSAIRYPLDVSRNNGDFAARPRRPTLPHSWPTTTGRPAPTIQLVTP